MVTRKEQARLAKDKIIRKAIELISKEGYENVSVQDVMHACDMSVGNFYNYFKSKSELITVMERTPYVETPIESYTEMSGSTLEKLKAYMNDYIDVCSTNFSVALDRQWFIYHANNPTALDDPENKGNILINDLEKIIARGIETGELKGGTPANTIAKSIAFMILGISYHGVITDGAFDREAYYEDYESTVLPAVLSPWQSN